MFENSRCLGCQHLLGFLPDQMRLASMEPTSVSGVYHPCGQPLASYRTCQHYRVEQVCNWMIEASDPNPFCLACRLNRTIPDLNSPANHQRWQRLESAKRRLLYTLFQLGLPARMVFNFLVPSEDQPLMIGHSNGVITINALEADEDERERQRVDLHEPYRTLLGHFRHESGHFYWDSLIRTGPGLEAWRSCFGDERQDYEASLHHHYQVGAEPNWRDQGFISAYASSHPWEDWAETWAHYLHMIDTMETSQEFGLLGDFPRLPGFDEVLNGWHRLTYALNSIHRSLGERDIYPFVVTPGVAQKLHFIHNLLNPMGD